MEIKIENITDWSRAKKAALFTIGKTIVKTEPDAVWIDKMLTAEHSPIREKIYSIELLGIPYWIANHFRTHFIGANYYISTSREDRTSNQTPRSELAQDAPVNMLITANAQTLINISRKRLCNLAHADTRAVWHLVVRKMRTVDLLMAKHMIRECEYRGRCPEIKPCGHGNI